MALYSKKELRKRFLTLRGEMTQSEKAALDAEICASLLSLDEVMRAKNILVYAPFRNEIDLVPFFEQICKEGKRTAFPKCEKDGRMDFFFCEYSSLSVQAYGIKEPSGLTEMFDGQEDTVCILPCLAVREDGYRLGYGGGYYDRFLSKYDLIKIAPVYSDFVIESNSFDKNEFDIPTDIIITEEDIKRL